ncbi:hypothetical protein G4D82_09745 [Flavobacterium sp. CYK-4]|uniref:XAC2610-related protein n=1 Tax=Flavobacterium lotistagni TaxID=2709660 RepID=UPI0014075B61|nr:hypothetical protein [Flavobacterium lotistagni]NHM07502.1 hypothetical protein [Flavobacterium lotistagni]
MKIKIVFLFFICSLVVNGQNCLHKNLSKDFNFKIELQRIKDAECKISLSIINKHTQAIQSINFDSESIFEKDFKDCSTVRSYTMSIRNKLPGNDNDFGDLIIADYNFDGKEDFAIKKDSGGNGGPLYSYYLQSDNSKFIFNEYLSNQVEFFPSIIDAKKETLTTIVHANAYQDCKTVYKYDSKNKNWKVINRTYVE